MLAKVITIAQGYKPLNLQRKAANTDACDGVHLNMGLIGRCRRVKSLEGIVSNEFDDANIMAPYIYSSN